MDIVTTAPAQAAAERTQRLPVIAGGLGASEGTVGLLVSAYALGTVLVTIPAIIAATVLWGLTFGGASAHLQAALTSTGGADSDVANAFLPVASTLAIFAAGILGAALLLTVYGRRSAFLARL